MRAHTGTFYSGKLFAGYNSQIVEMVGGINENVSSLSLGSGELIDCKNYTMTAGTSGGYKSLSGYERYDGSGTPSMSGTTVVELLGLTEEVTGSPDEVSIYGEPVLSSGSYEDLTAVVTIELIAEGDVAVGDTLTWGLQVGTANKVLPNSLATDSHHGALEARRGSILEVPGEGAVLGVHVFEGDVYAFRKDIGSLTVSMYKEDLLGWVIVTTPTMVYEEGMDYHFKNFNFSANVDEYSMYWVDNVNKAHRFDGTTVSSISSGMALDRPTDVGVHGGFYLALAFTGGSFQLFTEDAGVFTGYQEFGMGSGIVELADGKEDSTVLFLKDGIKMLTGVVASEFVLQTLTDKANPREGTIKEMMGTFFYVDDNGLTTLSATEQYGNYLASSISQNFKKTLLELSHEIVSTCVVRDLNQYRILFDDGQGIVVTFEDSELKGATLIEYDRNVVATTTGSTQGGMKESIFFIDGVRGYVYKMDSGTSFDGVPIICRLSTSFFHYGSPRTYKNFKRATMEVNGEPGQLFSTKTEFDYNEGDFGPSIWYDQDLYNKQGTATWGESRWGTMIWGTANVATNRLAIYLAGYATNMSYKFLSKETYRAPHVLQDIITDFTLCGRRV